MSHLIVPLMEVTEHADNIRLMNLQLPGVDIERLNVDVTRLQRAMHWGGIKLLALGSFEGEESEYTATGVSVNPDGTMGVTGSKISKKARLSDTSSNKLDEDIDYNWRNSSIYFNSTGFAEKSADEKTIVREIDRSLRSSLISEIVSTETSPKRFVGEIALAASIVAVSKIIPFDLLGDMGLKDIPGIFLPKPILPLLYKATDIVKPNKSELSPKYSTMFAWRVDRALLASRHLSRKIITISNE